MPNCTLKPGGRCVGEPRIGRQCAGVRVSVTLRARFAYDLRSSRVITVCDALVQASAFALPLYPLKQTLLTGGGVGGRRAGCSCAVVHIRRSFAIDAPRWTIMINVLLFHSLDPCTGDTNSFPSYPRSYEAFTLGYLAASGVPLLACCTCCSRGVGRACVPPNQG